MKGSNDTLDVVDAMEFAEVLYKCRLCTVIPCVVSSKYVFSLHVRSIHLTTSQSLPLVGCRRCHLKFATEDDLFDHKKQTHSLIEHQMNPETGKENEVAACGHQTVPLHGIDGENNSEDNPMQAVQHTRYNADQEHDCFSEDERTGTEDTSVKTHKHTGETLDPHDVSDTSDVNCHTDMTDSDKDQVQRTLFNILPVNRGHVSSSKRCHTESSLCDDPRRFVFLTAPDTDPPDLAQNLAGSHTNSPKSKRKRTVPVACRSVPTQSPMSDSSAEDSDLDMYDLHKHTMKDNSMVKDESDHIEKPANDVNDKLNTEMPVASPAATTDSPLPVNGRLRVLDAQKYGKTEWSLGPFVSNFIAGSDNASPHSDGSAVPPAGENEKQCLYCDYKYVDFDDYSQHYTERHVNSSTVMLDAKQDPANSNQFLGEPFVTKSNKIKEILPEFLCPNVNGCVSRSALMDRLAERLQQPDLTNWAPACNKAIRELFPHSQALRKGKYKKNMTYFFGIQFVGSVAATLSSAEKMDFVLDEDDPNFIPSPLRDMGKDTERLLKVLPCVIRFTGHMNNCVTRDMLLYILSEQLNEPDVTNWGTQCNRAVRHLYPQTYLKRKGKFKTCYFGIQLQDYIEARTPGKFGPPVVDVRDIISDDMIRKWESEPPVGGATRWSADGGVMEGVNEEKPGERAEETKVAIKQEPLEESSLSTLDVSPTLTSPAADRNVLERIVLLHPGPFVTERILRHRCMSLRPSSESAQQAMSMLQTCGLGEIRTVKPSNLRVFYKAMPHDSLEEPLSAFNVRLVDYQLMFSERDPKLEDTLHEQVKLAGPNLDMLPLFYKY